MTWEEARGECALYGEWLIDILDIREQNCLLRHAHGTPGLEDSLFFWTDGIYVDT